MKFLRIRQVMQLTGLSRMTIYRLELAGEFPKRRQLSKHSVAWLDSDIAQCADSGRCRPLIPEHAGPPFRAMSGHHSGACRHRV